METVLDKILSNPATSYILSFGGLGLVLLLALNYVHKTFDLTDRKLGLLTLGAGAAGGALMQAASLVTLPGHGVVTFLLAAFVGAACAAAAAGFSAVDLRDTIKVKPKE